MQNFLFDNFEQTLWQTWWFRLLGMTIVAAGVFVVYRKSRSRKIREIERLRNRIASDLHDEIGSSLGGIALMAEHMSERYTPEESGFRRLQEMSKNARQMSDSIRDIIWFVDTERSSFDDLRDRFQSIVRAMLPNTT